LPRILPDVLRRLTPYRNSVPLRLLALLAGVTVFPFLRGRYAQRCHRLPCACVSNLRVLPEMAGYRHPIDVRHSFVPLTIPRTSLSTRPDTAHDAASESLPSDFRERPARNPSRST